MRLSLALCAVIALATPAHANNREKADTLFKQGKKLMSDKRYADACESFENSQKLDPTIGTQLNIARCYEEWGKLASAYTAYIAAERMAIDAKDDRAPKIRELLDALEPNVPKLTLHAPSGARDVVATLDGERVATLGEVMLVDPGPHTIEWSSGGGAKQRRTVPIDRGSESEVTLDAPVVGNPNRRDTKRLRTDPAAPAPGRTQRMVGIGLGGAGIVAIGVSSYMTLSARSDYNDALDMHCGGMKNNCDMTGLEVTRDARSTANKATVVFLVGAALVGGGAALYFLAPKRDSGVYVAPAMSSESVGVVLGGAL
jgi:tetratricopeptide (TPR) repeat protein